MWMRILIISLLFIPLLMVQGCSKASKTSTGKKKIAATIFPLYDIARNIAGDKVEVVEILPPGASPHTYELTPRQVKQLQGVSVVFGIGHDLDNWADTLVDTLPDVRKIVVDEGIHLKEFLAHEEHGAHEHKGANPHYWLSVENGKTIAENIARELMRIDAANESYYRANLEAYLTDLDNLKRDISDRFDTLSDKKIITFHDAWFYFANEFGLEMVGTFEPFPGKQPTPRYLAELQETAKRNNVRAIFSEPQLSNEAIASFVSDIGLELYVLDPLGGVEGRDSYIKLFNYNADVITKALKHE